MKNHLKMIEKIKKKSFPLLKGHKIFLRESKRRWGVKIMYLYWCTFYSVGKGAKKGLSKGGIAHELSHVEIFKRWGILKTLWFTSLQYFVDEYRGKVERSADLLAIEKGYGKELHASRKEFLSNAPKEVRAFVERYYLSLEEIKKKTRECS